MQIAYARYGIVYQDFDETDPATNSEDYIVHDAVLGFSLSLGPTTTLGAEGGYFRQELEDRGGEDSFVFSANFGTRGERISFRAESNYGYELDYGTSENRGFSKFSDSSANVEYQVSENVRIFATASYRWEDFTAIDRTDQTYGARAGFTVTFWRWFALAFEGGHLERDSDDASSEFKDNRVTLRLTAAYPRPFSGE
jgi:hypothetical protein